MKVIKSLAALAVAFALVACSTHSTPASVNSSCVPDKAVSCPVQN